MFFVFVAIALVILVVGGRAFIGSTRQALLTAGQGARRVHVSVWLLRWCLFAYPLVLTLTIISALVMGAETMPRFEHWLLQGALIYPFFIMVLVFLQAMPYWLVGKLLVWRAWYPTWLTSRRRAGLWLGLVAALLVYTVGKIAWDHNRLLVRQHVVGEGPATFRIGFVADFQRSASCDDECISPAIAAINAANVDVVFAGGDWIDSGPTYMQAAARDAGELRSRLGTFSVRGDHEHFAYIDQDRSVRELEALLHAQDVAMLNNEVKRFDHKGKRLAVLFLNYNYIYRTPPEQISALIDSMQDADVRLMVTHQFDNGVAALVKDRVDWVLAAHTHGSQVNPLVGPWHVPLARVETPYLTGRYELGSTQVLVTSGVGFSIAPFRYASPGTVEILELRW